ncbi:MAG: NAD-binding protein [Hadesarchaea archaeon]|jgi:trk system potassium uptake protein TrkA|nr:NAD-binding protein [Hadesarchaea archaeon]
MKKPRLVLIAGGGRVGSHLAEVLTKKGRDVVLIDKDPQVCERLAERLNVLIIHGDATEKETLEEAKVGEADVFVGATGNDNDNIVACQLAKNAYGVPLVMARVEDPELAKMAKSFNIDLMVSPSHVASMVLENAISLPGTTSIFLSDTPMTAAEIRIPEGSKVVHKKLSELTIPRGCIIGMIYRNGELVVPRGDSTLEAGDIVAIMGKEEAIAKLVDQIRSR